jgi:hypothetical protein
MPPIPCAGGSALGNGWNGTEVWNFTLEAGPATVRLIVDNAEELSAASASAATARLRSARRNVDLVVLTSNFEEVFARGTVGGRIESNIALDGTLTQAGNVFMRVVNKKTGINMTLSVPFVIEHSSYWVHLRDPCNITAVGGPPPSPGWHAANMSSCVRAALIEAQPGATSEWTEVGSNMDVLNQGEWALQAIPGDPNLRDSLDFTIEVAVRGEDGETMDTIGTFDSRGCVGFQEPHLAWDLKPPNQQLGCVVWLAYDSNTRATKRIRLVEDELATIMGRLDAHVPSLPAAGHPPALSVITCTNCYPNASDIASPVYNTSAKRFRDLYGLSDQEVYRVGLAAPKLNQLKANYLDLRYWAGPQCSTCFDGIHANATRVHAFFADSVYASSPEVAAAVKIVSLGDEVTIPSPSSNPVQATAAFVQWAKTEGLSPADLGYASWTNVTWSTSKGTSARLFYYSSKFEQHWSIAQMKVFTDAVKQYLPNAGVGANFEPGILVDHAWKWIKLFREPAGFTLPWAEGYLFNLQNDVGSQQMNGETTRVCISIACRCS